MGDCGAWCLWAMEVVFGGKISNFYMFFQGLLGQNHGKLAKIGMG